MLQADEAVIECVTLLQKQFLGTCKNIFLEALVLAAKNTIFKGG